MDYNRAELKNRAKEAARGNTPKTWKVVLVYLLLTSLVSMVAGFFVPNPMADLVQIIPYVEEIPPQQLLQIVGMSMSSTIGFATFVSILVSLFSTVMQYGFCGYCLKTFRREACGYADLFGAFQHAGKVIGSAVMVWVFTFLWSIAIVVAGIIAIVLVVMALNHIMGLAVFFAVVLYLAILACVYAIALRYAMVPYLLADKPEIGVFAAIEESKQMMKGRKSQLFVLQLSFIGWYLLMGLIIFLLALLVGFVTVFAAAGADPYLLAGGADPFFLMAGASMVMVGVTLLGFAITLPLSIWLTGYIGSAVAGFYQIISGGNAPSAQGIGGSGEPTIPPVWTNPTPTEQPHTPENPAPPAASEDGWNLPNQDD